MIETSYERLFLMMRAVKVSQEVVRLKGTLSNLTWLKMSLHVGLEVD